MSINDTVECYCCAKYVSKKKIGATLGSSIKALQVNICTDCVHKNYCWATDKELEHHDYSILESRRQSLLRNL